MYCRKASRDVALTVKWGSARVPRAVSGVPAGNFWKAFRRRESIRNTLQRRLHHRQQLRRIRIPIQIQRPAHRLQRHDQRLHAVALDGPLEKQGRFLSLVLLSPCSVARTLPVVPDGRDPDSAGKYPKQDVDRKSVEIASPTIGEVEMVPFRVLSRVVDCVSQFLPEGVPEIRGDRVVIIEECPSLRRQLGVINDLLHRRIRPT